MAEVLVEIDLKYNTRWVTRFGKHYHFYDAMTPTKFEITDEAEAHDLADCYCHSDYHYNEFKERQNPGDNT